MAAQITAIAKAMEIFIKVSMPQPSILTKVAASRCGLGVGDRALKCIRHSKRIGAIHREYFWLFVCALKLVTNDCRDGAHGGNPSAAVR